MSDGALQEWAREQRAKVIYEQALVKKVFAAWVRSIGIDSAEQDDEPNRGLVLRGWRSFYDVAHANSDSSDSEVPSYDARVVEWAFKSWRRFTSDVEASDTSDNEKDKMTGTMEAEGLGAFPFAAARQPN